MQTVFKMRHFYKALNQQWSHVLIERGKEGEKEEVNCLVCHSRSARPNSKLNRNIQERKLFPGSRWGRAEVAASAVTERTIYLLLCAFSQTVW